MKFSVFYDDGGVRCSIELEGPTMPRTGDILVKQGEKYAYKVDSAVLKYGTDYAECGFEVFATKIVVPRSQS